MANNFENIKFNEILYYGRVATKEQINRNEKEEEKTSSGTSKVVMQKEEN